MGCKADFAVNRTALDKKFNARHVTFAARGLAMTGYDGLREVRQRFPNSISKSFVK